MEIKKLFENTNLKLYVQDDYEMESRIIENYDEFLWFADKTYCDCVKKEILNIDFEIFKSHYPIHCEEEGYDCEIILKIVL